jgi:hypothetical protein
MNIPSPASGLMDTVQSSPYAAELSFGGVMVIVFAIGPKVHEFKPG